MKRKNRTNAVIFAGLMAVVGLLYFTGDVYYQGLMDGTDGEKRDDTVYEYKFDMIVDSPSSPFWQEVYRTARKSAAERGILLEIKGTGWESNYDKNDFMNMSIASAADGIILQYNGEPGLESKIDEAVERGIPVVTVMNDAGLSRRQSFIGVSDYQLGTAYGIQAAEYVTGETERVLILLKRSADETERSQIYTRINEAVQEKAEPGQKIEVRVQNLTTGGNFDLEEAVTDIFQQSRELPDILICMDEETTECARQAVIDFNLAGKVQIIGYYASSDILSAVEKGVISATCDVDTTQLGSYSVEALSEYIREGRVSAYYNVDLRFLGKEEAVRSRREAQIHAANPME